MIQQDINNNDQPNSIGGGLALTKRNKHNGITKYQKSVKE